MSDLVERAVRPDGQAVRRMRHQRGWSPRTLLDSVERAEVAANGVGATLSPVQLQGIEDRDELVPYDTLCLLAGGFDCDPIELLNPLQPGEPEAE